ncbi:MAG: hypothetical protein ACI92C_002601, partial [Neolewinella sp.]
TGELGGKHTGDRKGSVLLARGHKAYKQRIFTAG